MVCWCRIRHTQLPCELADRASTPRGRSCRLEHSAPSWPALPVSRMTGNPRLLRPEERELIDSGGKNGFVTSVRLRRERHVVDRVPGPVHARDAGVHVAAGADADANAAVPGEILPLEGPESRVAGIGRRFRNLRSSGLL